MSLLQPDRVVWAKTDAERRELERLGWTSAQSAEWINRKRPDWKPMRWGGAGAPVLPAHKDVR